MNQSVELFLPLPIPQAAHQAQRALAALGQIQEATPHYLAGTVAYGFQRVSVRISWAEAPQGTRLILQGSSDDMWGAGAKNALSRLEATIRNIDVPGYQIDRRGIHPAALAGMVALVLLLTALLAPHVSAILNQLLPWRQ